MDTSAPAQNEKISFWKKNSKTVPGRASPNRDMKKRAKTVGSTSFQDFQASVNDAWEVEDDDFCIVSGARISKKVSQSAALNVLNNHRISSNTTQTTPPPTTSSSSSSSSSSYNLPPPQQTDSLSHYNDTDAKLDRFRAAIADAPNLHELCKLSWSGVPVRVRATTWRLLSGYLPINRERRAGVLERKRDDYWLLVDKYYYADHDEASLDIQHQINIDVPRMNPTIPLFQQASVQRMFERILFIWSIRHPASGYVQGINDLVTPFYVVFLQECLASGVDFETCNIDVLTDAQRRVIEADSFWCLSKFLDGIQDNYVFAQIGIQRKVLQLEELIKRVDIGLHRHLKRHNVSYLQFSFRWLNNLLTRELPLRCTIRLWDTYLAESDCFASFQLYVCAAFLLFWKVDLMRQFDFQGLLLLLQNLPTQCWTSSEISVVVAEAYKLKFIFADAPNHLQCGNTAAPPTAAAAAIGATEGNS